MPAYEFRRGFCTLVLSYSDEEWDQPLITEEAFLHRTLPMEIDTRILQEPLVHYSVLSETSFHIMQGLRMQCRRKIRFPDQMDYLMYILGKRENGLQIVYYCLKETQHRFHRHRMIVQGLERKGGCNLISIQVGCSCVTLASAYSMLLYSYNPSSHYHAW